MAEHKSPEDLASLVQYQKGSVVSRELLKKDTGTVTLFAFDQGQGLSEHKAPFDALVFIMDGAALSGTEHRLTAGQFIIMPAGEPHSLKAPYDKVLMAVLNMPGLRFAPRAFQYRNYRLYFGGQSFSLIGTWMQQLALGWLAYELTNSPFLLGIISFAGMIPTLMMSPIAGVFSDRWNRYYILLTTPSLWQCCRPWCLPSSP